VFALVPRQELSSVSREFAKQFHRNDAIVEVCMPQPAAQIHHWAEAA
jgi:hypothetical protein